ncbi:MAG: DUF2336 domain-containing protein [Alphaproteobacteria bacterium]
MAAPAYYEELKRAARSPELDARLAVAANPRALPEILYFLVNDPSPRVRAEVAGNIATPPQADQHLSQDPDYGVRVRLARKFAATGLSPAERTRLWRLSSTAFETLAHDRLLRVRQLLAESLCILADVPRLIVMALARDPAEAVASPVLRHSPVLEDEDLVEIMTGEGAPVWVGSAIAGRKTVSDQVARTIRAQGDARTMAILANNPGAGAAQKATERPRDGWSGPDTSPGGQTRPAAGQQGGDTSPQADPRPTPSELAASAENAREKALELARTGLLSTGHLSEALASGERDFLEAGLAIRAGLPLDAVRRILGSRSPRRVTALAWKAGCSMRFAVDLQIKAAKVHPAAILYAREGVAFPLSDREMEDQLDLFLD